MGAPSIQSKKGQNWWKKNNRKTMNECSVDALLDAAMNSRKQMSNHHSPNSSPLTIDGGISCSCCNRALPVGRETVGDTKPSCFYGSLFKDDSSDTESSSQESHDMDDQDHMMPGVLAYGIPFTVTRDIVQGWIHKKGTGMDWLGSRAWKARWAVLSMARIAGHEVDVPLLQVFWSDSSPTPSTVIHLDSAIVLPEDLEDKTLWNCFRFQIRHVRKSVDEHSVRATRVFSCPKTGRDTWCQAINQALLQYEKDKAHARRQSAYLSLSPPRWRAVVPWAMGDAHPSKVSNMKKVPRAPPTSPSFQPKNLPRHEPSLIGEVLLTQSVE
eukprot:Nitzschia sp. Nitz4//scaffold35_size145790//113676//114729//NITZ4_003047-RA/size145790-augustus-gene-0.137-mRNA-1//-1//CDS//3329549175//3992//frame0